MNNSRVLLIIMIVFICFVLLGLKLFSIQIGKHEYYTTIATRQQNKTHKLKAERGAILDRTGAVLTFTKSDVSVFVDKRMLNGKEKDSVASFLSKVFKKSPDHYLQIINEGRNNICLEKKVPKDIIQNLEDFYVDGFFIQEDFTRVYPYGSLASHVLGYVDNESKGVYGVEKKYNSSLTGKDGYKHIENDVLGRTVSVNNDKSVKPVNGGSVTLTINKDYQTVLERELKWGLKEFDGDSATGIIMNPNTGEILALTSLPDYDPGNFSKFNLSARRNRSITDPYEPGSIIKPIIMSMLVEEKLISGDEIINTENGTYKFRSAKITDTHPHAYLTARGILEESSNIGMAKISTRISQNNFYKYLRDFGFGNVTDIDLPGESKGYLKKPKKYSKISKPFMSFGYELSVTPIQMLTAFSAAINGGYLYRPYIVKEVKDHTGKVTDVFSPEKIRNVITKSTSDNIVDFLIGVVEDGTGSKAKLQNVLVGGKTGTAQMLINGNYSKSEYNASFVGFFPAENPKIACLIQVSSPSVGRYGGQVAAPIFQRVAEGLIETDINLVPKESRIERRKEYLNELLISNKNSTPNSTIKFSNVGNVDNKPIEKITHVKDKMPNLINLSVREAVATLNELGLKYKVVGNGFVKKQSIKTNSNIKPGQICIINCETKSTSGLRLN
jgi:cell division protein FtsI (penicillin-binding protein 3)